MSKKEQTIREFTSESEQSPDTRRVVVDDDQIQVIDEHNLPDSSLPKEDSGDSQEESGDSPKVVRHTSVEESGDGLVIVERTLGEDLVIKRRYVDDPSEVPEGVKLQEGEKGGLYYDESSVEFLEEQLDLTRESLEETDYTDDEIEDVIETIQRHDRIASEAFSTAMEMAEDVGANVTYATHRVKGVGSALDKVYEDDHDEEEEGSKYDSADDLTDVHGSMLVVDDLDEARDTFEQFLSKDDVEVVKQKNHMDDTSGPYRAHHVVFEVEDGTYSEVQIKEERMSQIAAVSHSLCYKPIEAPIDEIDALDEPPEKGTEMNELIEDCLTQQADLRQGLVEEDEVECNEQAFNAIREYLELQGYV